MEEEIAVQIHTKAVHAGDRKKPGPAVPTTTPICTATTFAYEKIEELDRIFGREIPGYSYSRYDNPTNAALEELTTALEGGHGSLACASGMSALHMAMLAALADRRKCVLAADAMYGATVSLLMNVLEPLGVAIRFVDICDLEAVEKNAAGQQARLHPDGDGSRILCYAWSSTGELGEDRAARRRRARR